MIAKVNTSEFRKSHGHAPAGSQRGTWAFTFDRPTYDDVYGPELFWYNGTFAEARAAARVEAERRGASVIYAQP